MANISSNSFLYIFLFANGIAITCWIICLIDAFKAKNLKWFFVMIPLQLLYLFYIPELKPNKKKKVVIFMTICALAIVSFSFFHDFLSDTNGSVKLSYLQSITPKNELNDIFNFLGQPDVIEKGEYIYKLDDDSKILIGSNDDTTILYIKHIHIDGKVTNILKN